MNDLQLLALGLGSLAIIASLWAMRQPESAQRFLRELPRNHLIGSILMLVNLVWSLYMLRDMDLGDWNSIKRYLYFSSPILYFGIIRYVNDYIGARAVAWLLILAAKPVLAICFIHSEPTKLVMVVLAYAWIIYGMCIFSVPHWMRDLIAFYQQTPARWNFHCRTKLAMGLLLVGLGLFAY